jgi:hypothetical protein
VGERKKDEGRRERLFYNYPVKSEREGLSPTSHIKFLFGNFRACAYFMLLLMKFSENGISGNQKNVADDEFQHK